ncbi:hypothetical protein SOVF_014150 [Spinacia oleracea]|uniref:F-box protein SKIP23 n=1 Tax=Spinacia oleracea TaxID=3562 RepID=A0A9R0HSQ1_SPIOL|nr:F-box protein SKIP23-like [Spinacia oleracea]KNA24603.1 hypothetical protein SOVF_014150 [Spinacia oleracea]
MRNCKMGRFPPWSDLPQELLSTIAEFLTSNPIDLLSFRSVCKSWSLSLPSQPWILSPPLPINTPPPPHSIHSRYSFPLSYGGSIKRPDATVLSVTVIYVLRPPIEQLLPSWMPKVCFLFLDQASPGKFSIRKPFSQFPYSMPINFPGYLTFLGFRASELGRIYNISYLSNSNGKLTKPSSFGVVHKVVVFSNDYGLTVVALSDEGKLGMLKLGLRDNYDNLVTELKWEIVHDGKGFRFDDIVDFKGRLLGIDRRGRVYEIEIGCASPAKMNAIVIPITGGGGRRKRLVESLGRLHLVVRCNVVAETDSLFKVYVTNEGTKRWVEVHSLCDETFFFGVGFSLSVAAEKLHGSCGKNCILFKEHSFLNYSGYDDDSALFKKVESVNLNVGVWKMEDASHLGLIGSHCGYSALLWPPPSWIWPKDRSERLAALIVTLDQFQSRILDQDKPKFKELSLLQQVDALKLITEVLKLKTEIFRLTKLLTQFNQFRDMKRLSDSVNEQDQVGTSSLGTEESRESVNVDSDWLFMETNINTCVLQDEEKTSSMETKLKQHKFCVVVE